MPRPLSQEARRKAIDAVLEMVIEHGVERVTIDGVARRSGVAKTTVYRHWSSVTSMLADALESCVDPARVPDEGSLRDDLRALVGVLTERMNEPNGRRILVQLIAASLARPALARVKQELMEQRTDPARTVVTRAIERGEIPPIDLDVAIHLIHGPFLSRMLASDEAASPAEIVTLVDRIVLALGAGPG